MCLAVKEQSMLTNKNRDAREEDAREEDAREAWVLRAGAELWKAVVAEAGDPAEDTRKALFAVRAALDCARRLRCCSYGVTAEEHARLSAECERAAEAQMLALRAWGRGRGLRWDDDWGIQWGEALSAETGETPPPTDDAADTVTDGQRRQSP